MKMMTSEMFTRRFMNVNAYVLMLKLKTHEASSYIKKISLVSIEDNQKFETISIVCDVCIFFITLLFFIFASVDLSNRKYSQWMSINKSLLRVTIIQILSSGVISICFDLFGSEYTKPLKIFENFFQELQVVLNFSIFVSGFFFGKRIGTGPKTLKNVAIGIIGFCYIGKKLLKIIANDLIQSEFLNNLDTFASHYLFLIVTFFYLIILILTISFFSELANRSDGNSDKFTTILNTVSFISLTIYLIGESVYELSLTQNSVFTLFATRINLCFFNCFILILSTPLSPQEEEDIIEKNEKQRKEFGSELKIENIDHLDKYDPEGLEEEEGYEDFEDYEDDIDVEVEFDDDEEDEEYSVSSDEEGYEYDDKEKENDSEDSQEY